MLGTGGGGEAYDAPRVNNKAIPTTIDRVTSEPLCVLLCFTCLSSS